MSLLIAAVLMVLLLATTAAVTYVAGPRARSDRDRSRSHTPPSSTP